MQCTLSDIQLDDSDGMRFSKLQLWVRNAVDNAEIGYTIGGLLSDIDLSDSEGVRFAKLQRWLTVLANGLSGGGGGGGSGTGFNATITNTTQLASITTTTLTPPSIMPWIQTSDLTQQVWILLASTAADDPTNGVVRPADYSVSNQKVWFRTS